MAPKPNLAKRKLAHANLAGDDLSGADLTEADLRYATLKGTNLAGAKLDRADLHRDNLETASLREARLTDADLTEADLAGADLAAADLRHARLTEARLRGTNLAGANLAEADLEGADLEGANPEAARSLAGARLRRAHGLRPEQWNACAGKLAAVDRDEAPGDPDPAGGQAPMRATVATLRLHGGTGAEEVARAAAWRLASFPPPGLVGAFAVQTAPDAVAVLVVTGANTDAGPPALDGLGERLEGRAEPIEARDGNAWDLLALADDGRRSLG